MGFPPAIFLYKRAGTGPKPLVYNSIFSIKTISIILLLNSVLFDILTRYQPGESKQ